MRRDIEAEIRVEVYCLVPSHDREHGRFTCARLKHDDEYHAPDYDLHLRGAPHDSTDCPWCR